jgi:hypothetical protein
VSCEIFLPVVFKLHRKSKEDKIKQQNCPPDDKWALRIKIGLKSSKTGLQTAMFFYTWQVIMTNGVASQSLSKTWPGGQTNVRLKPTGGANTMFFAPNPT